MSVSVEAYHRNALCTPNSLFHHYHRVDSSAGGLLVPADIINQIVNIYGLLDIYIIEIYSLL